MQVQTQTKRLTAAIAAAAVLGMSCGAGMQKSAAQREAGAPPAPEAAGFAAAALGAAEGPLAILAQRPTARAGGGEVADAAALNAAKSGEWNVVREFAPASYDPD